MRSKTIRKLVIALVTTIAVLAIASTAIARPGRDHAQLTVQVAENGFDFVWDEDPVFDDGSPLTAMHLSPRGYIYEAGTLDGTNGINPDDPPNIRTRCSARGPATATSSVMVPTPRRAPGS